MRLLWLTAAAIASPAHGDSVSNRIEIGAGTAIPVALGLESTFHVTHRFHVDVAAGWMPPPYVKLINATVVAFDGYDDTTAMLIEAALDHSLIIRAGAGFRPFAFPLSFHAGYTLAALGGGLAAADVIEATTGHDVRAEGGDRIPLHATLHLLQVGAAWRIVLRDDLVLRVALEYTQPFASRSAIDVTPRTSQGRERIAQANAALDRYMDDIFLTYVKAPVIGISLRWR